MLHGGWFQMCIKLFILVTGLFACTAGFYFSLQDLINAVKRDTQG
jgi:hypothetical protein